MCKDVSNTNIALPNESSEGLLVALGRVQLILMCNINRLAVEKNHLVPPGAHCLNGTVSQTKAQQVQKNKV